MKFEKEPNYSLPTNFQNKVNAYKNNPPSEEMMKTLKRLASGEVPLTIKKEDIFGSPGMPFNPKDMGKFIDQHKSEPPSEDMKEVLRKIALGDINIISCINLHQYFGEDWTPEVYQRFLKEIEKK